MELALAKTLSLWSEMGKESPLECEVCLLEQIDESCLVIKD